MPPPNGYTCILYILQVNLDTAKPPGILALAATGFLSLMFMKSARLRRGATRQHVTVLCWTEQQPASEDARTPAHLGAAHCTKSPPSMASILMLRCPHGRVAFALWLLVSIAFSVASVRAQEEAGSVHAADGLTAEGTTTTVSAPTELPACTIETQSKMTQFSLRNIELQRRCFDQSGGVNAFPFDVAPSRAQLVRLSTSAACILVSKAVLRVIERECVLGEIMPVRATAETILKLNEDRKTLDKTPTPPEDELQKQIRDRAIMNHARDDNPITFSADQYPQEMQQYETQLTKAYSTGGIVLLSEDLKVLNDISATDQTGSESAIAAVAELGESSAAASSAMSSQAEDAAESAQAGSTHHSGSHGSMRGEAATASPLVDSGSLTDGASKSKAPSVSMPASASCRVASQSSTVVVAISLAFTLGQVAAGR